MPLIETRSADPLARALMPVLLHRLNNATQVLAGWNSLLGIPGAEPLLASRADDLAEAARTADEIGYVLAVLASAAGADLLLERRSAVGLVRMLDLVREALRRGGRDLAAAAEGVPRLAAAGGAGWEAAWATAAWLHACGSALPAGATLRWTLASEAGGWAIRCEGIDEGALAAVRAAIDARVEGCGYDLGGGRAALRLPPGSFAVGGAR